MNRMALITGGSRGIGRGIALALGKSGFDLLLNYAGHRQAAESTAADCVAEARNLGRDIHVQTCQADVGDTSDRIRLMEFARERFARLDLLVNNAGITSIGRADLLEATEDNFDALFRVNLKGPFFLSQLAARWMLELRQDSTLDPFHPKIVNVSSISGYTASVNRGDYCMAKAALGMMTKLFAVRLADAGIHVHEICPGIIESDMTAPVRQKYEGLIQGGLTPIKRWGRPDDIGSAVAAIANNAFPFSTGDVYHVDGGFHLRTL